MNNRNTHAPPKLIVKTIYTGRPFVNDTGDVGHGQVAGTFKTKRSA